MAAIKKNNPKTMDVSPPDTTAPDHSARPVIVTNRAMIQDPMMKLDEAAQEGPTTSPLLVNREKDVKLSKPKTIETKVSEEPAKQKESPAKSTDSPEAPVSIPVPQEDPEVLKVSSGGADALSPSKETKKPEPSDQESKPELAKPEVTDSEPPKPNDEPVKTEDAEPKAKTDSDSEKEAKTDPAEEPEEDQPENPKSQSDLDAEHAEEQAKLEAAETERLEHLKTLVAEKTYFVPIHHKGKHGGGWTVFLLLVVAAAVAGLLYVNMVGLN